MIAEIGLAALWLAAALALFQLLAGCVLLRVFSGNGSIAPIATVLRPLAVCQAILVSAAMLCLVWIFVQSDMSVKLVATNSHSAKPLLYKIAGSWGNHEGSMLLWVTILSLSGGAIALFERRLKEQTLFATLAAQAFISLGFFVFLLFASNPFERLSPSPPDGDGLNALLQDPGLAFHPPTLYAGYVGLSVAFSFAVGALLMRDVGPSFAKAMRPWVLAAWVFLTIGITAGSYWAYYELGWGGWWFWDPVENASLMPWIAATALLHSVSVLATRGALRSWTLMLAVVAFSMSMLGTFLVRSGILTSVHAFAVDPTRGTYILVLLTLYIGGALLLYATRAATISEGRQFELVSREGGLVLNNLFLSVILGIVLIGTLYPVFAQSFGKQVSIGPPYFNQTAGGVMIALAPLLVLGPLARWRHDASKALVRRTILPLLFGLLFLVGLRTLAPEISWLAALGLAAGIMIMIGSPLPLFGRNLRRTPLHLWGMVVAHFGVGLALVGMAADSGFMKERLVALPVGGTTQIGDFSIHLVSVEPVLGPNWTALEARIEARDGLSAPIILNSQRRAYANPATETSEAAIKTLATGQLYAVLGQSDTDGRWQLRIWWKPLVTLIWLGGIMIALGGALALIGRVTRDRRADRKGQEL